MNEIELKFKIEAGEKEKILNNLEKIGCLLCEKNIQVDCVYYNENNVDNLINDGTVTIRTRIINNSKMLLSLKKRGSEIYFCKEIEFYVEKSEKIEDFLNILGFAKVIEFKKIRKELKYDDFNICIDFIENVGDYIEIELLTKEENCELFRNKILQFANDIGLAECNIEHRYYPQIILEEKKKGRF